MTKAGLAVCGLFQQHFSKALKEKIDTLNGELSSLVDLVEDKSYRISIREKSQKLWMTFLRNMRLKQGA